MSDGLEMTKRQTLQYLREGNTFTLKWTCETEQDAVELCHQAQVAISTGTFIFECDGCGPITEFQK